MGYLYETDVRKGLEDSGRRNDFQVSAEYAVSRPHDDGLRLRAHPRRHVIGNTVFSRGRKK